MSPGDLVELFASEFYQESGAILRFGGSRALVPDGLIKASFPLVIRVFKTSSMT